MTTIEEAAKEYAERTCIEDEKWYSKADIIKYAIIDFIAGANWQKEQSEIDLNTLQYVKSLFGLQSDFSTKSNGYVALCKLIENKTNSLIP